ncbi:MAG: ABC transporter ATP-binding protein [Lachnospiraceae bacterium]|nr:ABC transporter ATP-binding protein [Lachnospiraceae bacterium]
MKKESDFKILRRLFSLYAVHNKSTITACIFCAIVTGLRPYIMIVLSGILIDGLIGGMPFSTLMIWLAAGLAVNFAAEALEAWLREAFNAKVENCLERQNRDMNEKSLYSDFENLENPEIQEKKRKQEQVVNVRGGIYWMLIWPMDKGLTGLIIVVTAIIVAAPLFAGGSGSGHPGLIVMSIILAVMIVACSWASYKNSDYWNKKIHKVFDQYAKCNRVSNYILHSILSGSETGKDLRIFGQQELIEEGVLGQQQEALEKLKEIRKQGMTQSGIEATLTTVNCGLIYLYAAFKAYLGLITVGSVVKYASGIIQCINGIKNILFCATGWRQAVDYGREYLEYLEFENSTKDGSGHVSENEDQSILLECEHVSFRYPGTKEDAIHDLNLKMVLKPGDHIAIVGRNGSGKTTFIKLLCRLYNVTEGVIRVNGKDIRDYAYEEYVDFFSVVFQDYRMFSLELGENIAASEKVEEERVLDAMRKAGLGHRLENLPNGLDTYVGKEFEENGVNFSGGERQKLAIARAIYKDAPFVIMDEPTAALDPISECDVYESFDRLVGHKAAVYISHRLASCRFCDKILVFSEGGVVQNGSHEALVEQKGLYREMWNAQAQWYAETAEG